MGRYVRYWSGCDQISCRHISTRSSAATTMIRLELIRMEHETWDYNSSLRWNLPRNRKKMLEHDDVIKWKKSALLALCAVNSPIIGEFPSQRPVTRSFDVFFDLRLNKRLSKHSRHRWFDTPSCSLWRQCNERWNVWQSVGFYVIGRFVSSYIVALRFYVFWQNIRDWFDWKFSWKRKCNFDKILATGSTTRVTWWRHQMETFSVLLALCAGNSPVTGEFPTQRPVTRSFDVFFDLRLNKRLSKQPCGWWIETLS